MGRDFNKQETEYLYDILDSIYIEKYSGNDSTKLNTYIARIIENNKEIINKKEAIRFKKYHIDYNNDSKDRNDINIIEENEELESTNNKLKEDIIKLEKEQNNNEIFIENNMNKKISISDIEKHMRKIAFNRNIFDRIDDEDFSLDNAVQKTNAIRSGFIRIMFNAEIDEKSEEKRNVKKAYDKMLLKARESYIAISPKAKSVFQQFSNYSKKEVAKELGLSMSSEQITYILEQKERKLFGTNVNTKFNTQGLKAEDITKDDQKIYTKVTSDKLKEYAKLLKDMKEIIGAKPWYTKIFNSKHNKQMESFMEAKKALITKRINEKALEQYLSSNKEKANQRLDEMISKSADQITRFGFENSKRQGLIPQGMSFEEAVKQQLEYQNKQKQSLKTVEVKPKTKEYDFGFGDKAFETKDVDEFVVVDEVFNDYTNTNNNTKENNTTDTKISDNTLYVTETLEDLEDLLK